MAADCKSIAICCFPVADGVGLRQYRVVRWFLLPEAELCLLPAANAGFQIQRDVNENRRSKLQICWNWNCSGLQIHRFCCFPVADGVGLRQYRAVRWVLTAGGRALSATGSHNATRWTRTGTGGGLENPAQQRYNCHQPYSAIIPLKVETV